MIPPDLKSFHFSLVIEKVFINIFRNSWNLQPGWHTHTPPRISVMVVRLAEPLTNMRTSCGPRPGSVLCFRQRGLCGGGLCHAIRMCGSVLWVLRKRARSSALSAGLITAWKNWGQQERHAGILPRPGHCSLFTANNPSTRLVFRKVSWQAVRSESGPWMQVKAGITDHCPGLQLYCFGSLPQLF